MHWATNTRKLVTVEAAKCERSFFLSSFLSFFQSHPTKGPVRFLTPLRFLVRKAEWSARRNFMPVLFSWSHQATGPIWLDTTVDLWFDRIINRTPPGPCTMPVRASCGPRTRFFNIFHIIRDPYGSCAGPARVPYMAHLHTLKEIDTTRICKNPARASFVPHRAHMGPLRSPNRLFTGCLWSLNLHGPVNS